MKNLIKADDSMLKVKKLAKQSSFGQLSILDSRFKSGKAMVKVAKLSLEDGFGSLSKMDSEYKTGKGALRPLKTYNLTKKQAIIVGAKLDVNCQLRGLECDL